MDIRPKLLKRGQRNGDSSQSGDGDSLYREIVANLIDGVWVLDAQGKTTYVNASMARMLECDASEMLGRHVTEWLFDPPPAHDDKLPEFLSANPPRIIQTRLRTARGTELWVSIAARVMDDASGQLKRLIAVISNMSERKATEAKLRRITGWYSVLSSVNETIFRVDDPIVLYQRACELAVDRGLAKLACVLAHEEHLQRMVPIASAGEGTELIEPVMREIPGGMPPDIRRATNNRETVVVNDLRALDLPEKELLLQRGLRSCTIAPIVANDAIAALLVIASDRVGHFDEEELHVLRSLAADISYAVESKSKERERELAHQALQEQQRLVTTLLRNVVGMAYRCRDDEHWTMEFVSEACGELTGYAPQDLIGNRLLSYEELVHPDDRERVREQVHARLKPGTQFNVVYRIVTATRQERWVWDRGVGVFDASGNLRFVEGFITDVTEQRRAQERIAAQAALLDRAKDAILVRDLDGTIVYWNAGAARLYGWTSAEAVGRKVQELAYRGTDQFEAAHRELLQKGELSREFKHVTKAGEEITVEASWTLMRDSHGLPQAVFTINTDVTARKQLEAQVARAQRLESIGTLAGGIAHDFNNILAAIAGNASLAISDLPATHPIQASLNEIAKAAQRGSELVRQILTFSRQQESLRQSIDLAAVIEEGLRLLRAMLPPSMEIRSHFGAELPNVSADPLQVQQALVNLGTNAAQAIGPNGGKIDISLDALQVGDADAHDLDVKPGRYLRLTMTDTGPGIPPELMTRIFEPFFTTKPVGQGTGLGLGVVHGIMKNHEGAVSVHSTPGEGASFSLYFPVIEASRTEAPAVQITAAPAHGQHILYVDDEEPLVYLATRVLERLGYRVTGFTDPRLALLAFRDDPQAYDAVVTDLAMPVMPGQEFASEVLKIRAEVPVIMTSGYIRPDDAQRARELGVRELILKPNSVEDLGRALHRLLTTADT